MHVDVAYRCLSSSFRFIMEEVDIVIVGAEGVAESGGVINKVEKYCQYESLLEAVLYVKPRGVLSL